MGLGEEVRILQARAAAADERIRALEGELAVLGAERDRLRQAIDILSGSRSELEAVAADDHTGKYRPLWEWLRRQTADPIRATFGQIEGVLGFPLPPSSRRHLPHWYGYGGSAVARAIRDAGYRARHVDLDAETVEFHKLGGEEGASA